jgi:hypothetical protein
MGSYLCNRSCSKVSGVDIIAGRKGTVGAVGIIVPGNCFTELADIQIIHMSSRLFFVQVSENTGFNKFLPPGYMTLILVPEKMTGMHISIPRKRQTRIL